MMRIAQTTIRSLTLLSIVCVGAALGQDYAIDWYSIDSGGVISSTGDGYELVGTIGQPEAGEMSGGTFTFTGGFWLGYPLGDFDADGDVDLDDFAELEACLQGPGGGVPLP